MEVGGAAPWEGPATPRARRPSSAQLPASCGRDEAPAHIDAAAAPDAGAEIADEFAWCGSEDGAWSTCSPTEPVATCSDAIPRMQPKQRISAPVPPLSGSGGGPPSCDRGRSAIASPCRSPVVAPGSDAASDARVDRALELLDSASDFEEMASVGQVSPTVAQSRRPSFATERGGADWADAWPEEAAAPRPPQQRQEQAEEEEEEEEEAREVQQPAPPQTEEAGEAPEPEQPSAPPPPPQPQQVQQQRWMPIVVAAAPPKLQFKLTGDPLEFLVAPGDILLVRGSGRLAEIGNAGGFLGHVLVVLAPPTTVQVDSVAGKALRDVWPSGLGVTEMFRVRTVESTRREQGLYESDMLVYVDRTTRRLTVAGEVALSGQLAISDPEVVECWQSPDELRAELRLDLMQEVLRDMRASQANWSLATGVRALFSYALQADAPLTNDSKTLQDLAACWIQPPICTSVVISFWQRYLTKLCAASTSEAGGADASARAVGLILKYMPLRADRSLAGDLVKRLRESSWSCLTEVPRIFRPTVVQPPVPVQSIIVRPSVPQAPQAPPQAPPGEAPSAARAGAFAPPTSKLAEPAPEGESSPLTTASGSLPDDTEVDRQSVGAPMGLLDPVVFEAL